MKYLAYSLGLLGTFISLNTSAELLSIQDYVKLSEQKKLEQNITWKRLLYAEDATTRGSAAQNSNQSEVSYAGYFLASDGRRNIKNELVADIAALFQQAEPNQSFRCKFPARSQWLMQQLKISAQQLPQVACPEFEQWYGQIKPYKATLIYATDFMGNPSSMFGHTLLRLDPKDQRQLNLVSYAVNYAATVNGQDNWSYAWKGLVGD